MSEHLTLEQVAALIDDSEGAQDGLAHVEECEVCAREFEQMSRMRMALSALPDLAPPSGEWSRIERMLPGAPTTVPIDHASGSGRDESRRPGRSTWTRLSTAA
ncbi:MAG: hypothetical protein ABFS14_12345, partial [Gemmatimonadota bacterium]